MFCSQPYELKNYHLASRDIDFKQLIRSKFATKATLFNKPGQKQIRGTCYWRLLSCPQQKWELTGRTLQSHCTLKMQIQFLMAAEVLGVRDEKPRQERHSSPGQELCEYRDKSQ